MSSVSFAIIEAPPAQVNRAANPRKRARDVAQEGFNTLRMALAYQHFDIAHKIITASPLPPEQTSVERLQQEGEELQEDWEVKKPNETRLSFFFTGDVGPCIAVAARGKDSQGNLVAIGIAHHDGIPRPLILPFLKKIESYGAVSIDLFCAGGTASSVKPEESTWNEITREIREYQAQQGCAELRVAQVLDHFRVNDLEGVTKRSIAVEEVYELIGFSLSVGTTSQGKFLIAYDDSVMKRYDKKILEGLVQFHRHDFGQVRKKCRENPEFQNSFCTVLENLYLAGKLI